ncbi:MAG: PilZ domain-containing protein [Myxococcota bacterium]
MYKLNRLLIAEPVESTATHMAESFARLADSVDIVHRGQDAIDSVATLKPDMVLLSLELPDLDPDRVLAGIKKSGVEPFVVATYRELSVQGMKKLGSYGIGEFASQPLDTTAIYRAASAFFGRPFRRHTRHLVSCPVTRVDGAAIGTTLDLSEGGMLVSLNREVTTGMSQLWEIDLKDEEEKPLRVRCVVLGTDTSEGKQTAARVEFDKLIGPDFTRLSGFLRSLEK